MSIDELNKNLDNIITTFQSNAAVACTYCDDEFTSNAISCCNQAFSSALASFKDEIICYLKNS